MIKKTNLKVEVDGPNRTIFLKGSINAQNSNHVQENVVAAAEGWAEERVILALGGVDYVSSAALRVFMELWRAAKASDCDLVLAQPTEDVREVLELTGFQNIFTITSSLEEARASRV